METCPSDGFHTSPLPGIHCIKISHETPKTKGRWAASFSLVVQGGKEITLGRHDHRFTAAHYIATPVVLPVTSRVFDASALRPFLCFKIDFDAAIVGELVSALENDSGSDGDAASPLRAIFGGPASAPMLDALLRTARLLANPQDAPVLAPLAIKEVFYHLMRGPDGKSIRQFVHAGSHMQRIAQAVLTLRTNLQDAVDVDALAKAANMSRSAFFKHFKDATSLSPIQYQKRLRLLEARQLMVEGETAASAAFKVGYNSASQFSREYARMFGDAPARDVQKNHTSVDMEGF